MLCVDRPAAVRAGLEYVWPRAGPRCTVVPSNRQNKSPGKPGRIGSRKLPLALGTAGGEVDSSLMQTRRVTYFLGFFADFAAGFAVLEAFTTLADAAFLAAGFLAAAFFPATFFTAAFLAAAGFFAAGFLAAAFFAAGFFATGFLAATFFAVDFTVQQFSWQWP